MKNQFLSACLLALAAAGCEEPLPARNDPSDLVRTRLYAMDTRLVILDSTSVVMGAYMVRLALDNLYNDVLDGAAKVRGNVRVRLRDFPDRQKTFTLDGMDLLTPWVLRGNTATLGIDSAAILSGVWDHRMDNGDPFWLYTDYKHYITPGGLSYYLSDSVYFVAEGSMQLFQQVEPLQAPPVTFAVVYEIVRVTPPEDRP